MTVPHHSAAHTEAKMIASALRRIASDWTRHNHLSGPEAVHQCANDLDPPETWFHPDCAELLKSINDRRVSRGYRPFPLSSIVQPAALAPSTSAATRGEPVAWRYPNCGGGWTIHDGSKPIPGTTTGQPLYDHPAPAVESAQVKVKAITWERSGGNYPGQEVWHTGEPWVYWIVKNGDGPFVWCDSLGFEDMVPASPVRGTYPDLDAAKAAAQADFESRIRASLDLATDAALSPSPSAGEDGR